SSMVNLPELRDSIVNNIAFAYLGLYTFTKAKMNSEYGESEKRDPSFNQISHISQLNDKYLGNERDVIGEMVIKSVANYFAPGVIQAVEIVSNLFKQGDLAARINERNRTLDTF